MKISPINDGKVLTFRSVVMPWQCDQNGHVNTRFYMEFFDSAASALLSMLGSSMAQVRSAGRGWVDARAEVSYLKEVRDGEMITVWSGIRGFGTTSLKYFHELYTEDNVAPAATCEAIMVHFDLAKRAKTELPEAFRTAARPLMAR